MENAETKPRHVIIYGDPVDGLKFVGPFKSAEKAIAYADSGHFDGYDWWVTHLETPENVK